MQLAISNIAFEEQDAARVYALMQRLGVTGLEIAPSKFIGANPYAKAEKAAQKAQALHTEYGLVIPSMQSIWFGQLGNIFVPQEAARLADYTRCAVDFAAEIGCKSLVFGCPKNRFMLPDKTPQHAFTFFAQICAYAARKEVAIALEANPPVYGTNFINTTAQAFAFAKAVPGLCVNYDVGTCLTQQETLDDLWENLQLVSHIHLSEPALAPIIQHACHAQLAQGLRAHNYQGFVSIEMKTSPYSVVEQALTYLVREFA